MFPKRENIRKRSWHFPSCKKYLKKVKKNITREIMTAVFRLNDFGFGQSFVQSYANI